MLWLRVASFCVSGNVLNTEQMLCLVQRRIHVVGRLAAETAGWPGEFNVFLSVVDYRVELSLIGNRHLSLCQM
jgi:hypothetical protein